jgi:hypothetical protein
MNLIHFGRKLLKFPFWEQRELAYPFFPGPFPVLGPNQSRQGVLMLAGFPTGAVVNAIPLAGDRGNMDIKLNWLDAPPDWNDTITLRAFLVGDPIDPLYTQIPANAAFGRTSIQVALADTAGDVTGKVVGALGALFAMAAPLSFRWDLANGRRAFQDPQTRMVLIAPRTAKAPELQAFDLAFAGVTAERIPASVVPFVFAGLRPGPQVVKGNRFEGFAPPDRDE